MPSNFNSPVPRIRHHLLQLGLQSLLTRYGVRLARAPVEVVVPRLIERAVYTRVKSFGRKQNPRSRNRDFTS